MVDILSTLSSVAAQQSNLQRNAFGPNSNVAVAAGAGAINILNGTNGSASNPIANINAIINQTDIDGRINNILSQSVARLTAIRRGQIQPGSEQEELAAALQLAGQPFRLFFNEQTGAIEVEAQAVGTLRGLAPDQQRIIQNFAAELEDLRGQQALVDTRTELRQNLAVSILRVNQLQAFFPANSPFDFSAQRALTSQAPFTIGLSAEGQANIINQFEATSLSDNFLDNLRLRETLTTYRRAQEIIDVASSRDPNAPTVVSQAQDNTTDGLGDGTLLPVGFIDVDFSQFTNPSEVFITFDVNDSIFARVFDNNNTLIANNIGGALLLDQTLIDQSGGRFTLAVGNANDISDLRVVVTDDNGATTFIDGSTAEKFIQLNSYNEGTVRQSDGTVLTPSSGNLLTQEQNFTGGSFTFFDQNATDNVQGTRIIAANLAAATTAGTSIGGRIFDTNLVISNSPTNLNPPQLVRLQLGGNDIVTTNNAANTVSFTNLRAGDAIVDARGTVIGSVPNDETDPAFSTTLTIADSLLGSDGIFLRSASSSSFTTTITRGAGTATPSVGTQAIDTTRTNNITNATVSDGSIELSALDLGDGDRFVLLSGLSSDVQFQNTSGEFIIPNRISNGTNNDSIVLSVDELASTNFIVNSDRAFEVSFAGGERDIITEVASGNTGTISFDASNFVVGDTLSFSYEGRASAIEITSTDEAVIRSALVTAISNIFSNDSTVSVANGASNNQFVITDTNGFTAGTEATRFRQNAVSDLNITLGTQTENENLNSLLGFGNNPVRTALGFNNTNRPFFFDINPITSEVEARVLSFNNVIPSFLEESRDVEPDTTDPALLEALSLGSEGRAFSFRSVGNSVRVEEISGIRLITDRQLEQATSRIPGSLVSLVA